MVGLSLLAEAHEVGLRVHSDHGRLVVRGPRSAEPLALQLLQHKAQVLAALAVDGASWSEWVEQRQGRTWRVTQHDGVEVCPWKDGVPWSE